MSRHNGRNWGSLTVAAGLALVILMTGVAASAQESKTADPLSALLNEVHALRVAMEQQATITPRIQLATARLNIEEQRLEQLNQQVQQVRRELTDATLDGQKLSAEAADVESQLRSEKDEPQIKALNLELQDLKLKIQANGALQEQLRVRESDIARALDTEQVRWIDLNNQIDQLESSLAPVRKQP